MIYGKTPNSSKWIIEQHANNHHLYDDYLPYEYHLRAVIRAFEKFKHLLPEKMYTTETQVYRNTWETDDITQYVIRTACWGHDLLEDTRLSYNDVKEALDGYNSNETYIVDIIYALTNEKGKTRKECANEKYYTGIRNTPGAVFVKLCDRIANVEYSKMTGNSMFDKYAKEQYEFQRMLGRYTDYKELEPMFVYLDTLLFN
jgi:(p)ppGpp synthase/HD superfamily hydrolase